MTSEIGLMLRELVGQRCACGKFLAEVPSKRRKGCWCSTRCFNLNRHYGITVHDYNALVEQQGGGCACCDGELRPGTGGAHVDHCHATGRVRGVLCARCNHALGHAKDSPETLRRLADYLEASREAA